MVKVDDSLVRVSRSLFDVPTRFGASKRHFTFIVRGKKTIICLGYNKNTKTHPIAAKYHYRFDCLHSEVDAVNKFPYPESELNKYKIINIRLLADGSIALSRPCSKCRKFLKDKGFKSVIYSLQDGRFVKEYL